MLTSFASFPEPENGKGNSMLSNPPASRREGKEQQQQEMWKRKRKGTIHTAHAASCQITDDPFLGEVQTKWSMSCIWQPNYDALRSQLCAIKTRIRDYILCVCFCVSVIYIYRFIYLLWLLCTRADRVLPCQH